MKKVLLAVAAAGAMVAAAPAEDLPKLSDFLTGCYRDNASCIAKIKNYVEAAKSQKIICLPADTSTREAASDTLHWLRQDNAYPKSLADQPFDDGLYEATSKLYPCQSEPPAPPPPQPAAPPAQ